MIQRRFRDLHNLQASELACRGFFPKMKDDTFTGESTIGKQ